jgi:hypothetical protein
MERERLSFETGGCLGDWLCMLSAAREYARRHAHQEIFIVNLVDVADAYGDGLVKGGRCYHHRYVKPIHREKNTSTRYNYLGTFLREICPEITESMTLDLPKFEHAQERIAVIQPYSGYAANPPTSFIQKVVDAFIETTGRKLYVIGLSQTKRDLANVDYSLLEDGVPALLRNISRADLALTPRSASAHAAAGYGIPSFVWVPNDGENWHLDYSGWKTVRIEYSEGSGTAIRALKEFIASIGTPTSKVIKP